ncbi:MAG TPA: formate dehydrogenase subunit delta [Steroidobacteraceae bacterium]|nr:formate dehydrogenase subunit delta [Steroidobacteraceae bacterium]
MSGGIGHLVSMANDIGDFFISEVGPAEAPASIALHLQRYWDPRMRAAIIAHVASGAEHLSAAALAAVQALPPPPSR